MIRRWAGPNAGGVRLGLTLESVRVCVDYALWQRARDGPDKGGLWYVGTWKLTLALPWWRGEVTYLRSVPARARAHELAVRRGLAR